MDQRTDVWLPASELVERHGKTGAIAYAAARIIERRGKDLKDHHRWRMIHCAIVELTRTRPHPHERWRH